MIWTILHARQQRRHGCKEQTFGVSGRRRGWDDLREWHRSICITMCKIDNQCEFDARSRAPKAGFLGQPKGIGCGGRWEGDSGRGVTRIRMANSC